MSAARSVFLGGSTIVLLIGAVALTGLDFQAIATAARQISAVSLLISFLLLFAGALLAVVRLWWISTDIGTRLNFRDAMLALSVGQIAGAISIQFFGQIAARSALLGRRGISSSANIVMASYERAAAVAVSAAMAIGGVVYLFGELSYDFATGGAKLFVIVAGLLFVSSIGAYVAWGRYALPLFKGLMTIKATVAILRVVVLTAAIQLCTAGAYVSIANTLTGTIPVSYLFAASLVVMFAASLPVSFSGWGMREIGAVFVLGAIGAPAPVALTMALVVGGLAFLAVILLAGATVPFASAVEVPAPIPAARPVGMTAFLKWVLPIVAATAVFFQVRVPTGTAELTVNLSDPVAILGGLVFVSEYRKNTKWRHSALPAIAGLWTVVLALAYVHGYFSFGSNDWATVNRLLGWFILICYVLTGALIVAQGNEKGAALFARSFAATACGVVFFWSTLVFASSAGIAISSDILAMPLSGFSQNRNAFSFALLMALCALPLVGRQNRGILLGMATFGLWLAGSYAAIGTLAVFMGLLLYFGTMSWRSLALALLGVGVMILVFQLMPAAVTSIVPDLAGRDSSNEERLASLLGGLSLFLSHPVFGAGLGYFVDTHAAAGRALVIHSTPVWLLAETGLLGFAAFVAPVALVFLKEFKTRNIDPASRVIVLALAAFSIMSQAHELLYQRPLWLVLGVALLLRPRGVQAPGRASAPT